MKRLTEKHYLGAGYYMTCSAECHNVDMDCIDCPAFEKLVDRLGAYEDTWLEPGEIKTAIGRWNGRETAEPRVRPVFCQYCGAPLLVIDGRRYCNNDQCLNCYRNA